MRVMDVLADNTAQVMGPLGETLLQTPSAVALLGDQTQYTGNARSATYRWFTDPAARERYDPAEHSANSRVNVALLRAAVTRDGSGSHAADLADVLLGTSEEFARLWDRHEVGLGWSDTNDSSIPGSDGWTSTASSCSSRTRASRFSSSPPPRAPKATRSSPRSPCWAPINSPPTPSDAFRGVGGTRPWPCRGVRR
nr:hypothetical protein [Streptomyces hygroscopicus]